MGDICNIKSGGTPNTKNENYWNGSINWATLADTKKKYLYNTTRKISQQGLENSNARLLPVNTVLFSSRATIGDVCIAKVETATNQGYKNFVVKDKDILHYEYLYYILKFKAPDIALLASGSTYQEVSKEKISLFQIPLPLIEEQQEIVAQLELERKMIEQQKDIIKVFEQKIQHRLNDLWQSEETKSSDSQ